MLGMVSRHQERNLRISWAAHVSCRRRSRSTLILVAAAILLLHACLRPAAAPAAGPVLAGDNILWGATSNGALQIHVAAPGTRGRVAAEYSRPGGQEYLGDLAASQSRVALIRNAEVLAGAPTGGFHRVEGNDAFGGPCAPVGVGLDGDLAVIRRNSCPNADFIVRDLSGATPAQTLNWPHDDSTDIRAPLRIAGRYVAWSVRQYSGDGARFVVVFDRLQQQEAYRIDLEPYLQEAPVNYGVDFDLQSDGTVALLMTDWAEGSGGRSSTRTATVAWYSPAQPYGHVVTRGASSPGGTRGDQPHQIALYGNLIVFRRSNDFAITDLQGHAKNTWDYGARQHRNGSLAFNGKRVAWRQAELTAENLYNEPYPVVPRADSTAVSADSSGNAALDVWCSTSDSNCAGQVTLETMPGSQANAAAAKRPSKLATHRFTARARYLRHVRIRLSPSARRTLRRHHRLRVRAVVVSRGKHGRTRSTRTLLLTRRRH